MLKEKMMVFAFLLTLASVHAMAAETTPFDKNDAATAYSVAETNKWVDDLLKQGREELEKSVGPVVLPEQNIEFDVLILWEDVKGGLNLTSGKLDNVFNIQRIGDVKLEYRNEMVLASVKLGVDNIKGSYFISFKFGHLHDAGTVTVAVESVQLGVEANQYFSPTKGDNNILSLDLNLHVKIYLGKIQVSVNMGGSATPFENQLKSQVEKHVRSFLPNLVKKHVGPLLANVADVADVAVQAYRTA